jgi:DNA modification methylase
MDLELIPIENLRPYPGNYRKHPPEQLAHLVASLQQYGWARNVVISSDGVILAGHGIVEAARQTGLHEVPVHRLEYASDDPRAAKFLVLENEVSRLAEDDQAQLAALLAEIQQFAPEGLSATGYDDAALDALIAEVAAEVTGAQHAMEDEAPAVLPEAITRLGDVWLMGEHRLVCGDCTEADTVASLFGDSKARMVWTDPPYGVSYADKNEFLNSLDRGNLNQTPIANDHMTEDATEALARNALTLMAEYGMPGAACYVACPPGTLLPHFIAAVTASGFTYHHSLVWVKQQFVLGRTDYHYRHEVILYGWKPDGGHYFIDDHTLDSVFEVDKPHRSEDHPTMKPVELVAPMIFNSSTRGDIVADPFLGSGTTLIAAEQLGRICYGIEIEPRYVDVAVRRWQALTGKQAILEATGEHFPSDTP